MQYQGGKSRIAKPIYGVGYIGEGEYTSKEDGKRSKIYDIWHSILDRCYDEKTINKFPTYSNCIVCDEWLNYQNFAKWYDDNYYQIDNEKMCVDKDILIKGNKVYSPKTCCIVPNSINILLTKVDKSRGEYPVGVSFHKATNKFIAKYKTEGKSKYIGLFSTPEDAFIAYKKAKESEIKRLANKYRDYIRPDVYNALINYEVEITD